MNSMKAARIHGYGGSDMLTYEDVPRPAPGAGEVLIKIHATSVNPFDSAVRAGYLTAWYSYAFPLILGLDVSGVVTAVGDGVTNVALGDSVYARADPGRNGAYAEYIVLPATAVAAKPQSLDHRSAAALPQALLTAWSALRTSAALTAGQTILIHGAAGGVGHVAVQLAKRAGARVIGTASGHNLGFLSELGADEAIDYTVTPFEELRNVDVVLDTIGGETQQRSWAVLKPGGIMLSLVQPPSEETAQAHGVRQQFVIAAESESGLLADFAQRVDAGEIRPEISATLPLRDARRAHDMIDTRHTRGKIVLQIVA